MAKISRNAGDQGLLRKVNLTAVLNCLRQHAPVSRATLAEMTGLNRATITRLVRDLIEHGFVRESGILSSATGRPSILLELDPEAGYIIGARLDVDYSSVILTNFAAEILWRAEELHNSTDRQEEIQQKLLSLIQRACAQSPRNGRPVLGVGLSLPGLVDVSNGTLLFAPNLGWRDTPVKAWLRQYFDFPIYVDNEANLAALGESYFGAARESNYILHINITAGVGAGIVLGQQILPGVSGVAGEVGHMTIDPQGAHCNCGNLGCWETFVSAPVLFKRIRDAIAAGQQSLLNPDQLRDFSRLTILSIVEAAQNGDEVVRNAFLETGRYIGLGVANLINVLNPEQVILGGYLSPIYPFILPEIKAVVQDRALRWSWEATEIKIAQYGSDASLMGAIATIYDHALSFPIETLARSADALGGERR
jgi:glucokinase-like ROK family protein